MQLYLRLSIFLTLLLGVSILGSAQRYSTTCFESFEVIQDVAYGKATTQGGVEQTLLMDIYLPKGDTVADRPLIIFAHGGYFLFGNKLGFKDDAEFFAKSGYVVASINYRLIDVEETDMASMRAVIDAVNDMKAAVRFFTKDRANENKYKIDTDNVFIGGYSAGAVTSLHYGYANTFEDIVEMGGQELLAYVKRNGGLEGQSGNKGYSSKIKGVINIAGSIHNAGLIDKNEPILVSVHGTDDQIVPFLSGTTGDTEVVTEGSGLIHQYADKIGLVNKLIAIQDEDHLVRYSCEDCMDKIRTFIANNL